MARAVQGGFFAGRRFYIYSRVDFLKIRGSAVLRSKMPACSGQADPCRRQARFCEAKCPHAAGRQTPAGGRRGFAKQNARMQRAGRPLPEAGAVLRSKMPACSGQARLCEAKCPHAAGRQTPAGDRRGFAKQNARLRRAGSPCRRQARLCEAKCPLAAGRQTPAGDRRGFAKQNARMQRASRPLPEAGAVLRSKMPACGGQAAGDFLGCGTQAILSGGTKRLCPAILDAEDGKATHGRHSPCLGGWLRAVLKL